jgi:hypothetical protein
MLSEITSNHSDSIQCRHCGVTLAARLLSCPSCGANQADSLDPLGWYPPTSSSAKGRLPPPRSPIAPQLAAPAAWTTLAGAEDDRFYAKHDPWGGSSRSRVVPVLVALLLALLVLAVAGYFVLRPSSEVGKVAPKAVFGSVTAQTAEQVAAVPAPASAAVAGPAPAARVTGAVVVKPSASAPLVAKQAEPAVSAPERVVPTPTGQRSSEPAIVARGSNAEVAGSQSSTAPNSVSRPSIAPGTVVQAPAAQPLAARKSTAQTAQISTPSAPKPSIVARRAETLAAVPHRATSPAPETKRGVTGKLDQARPDVSRNLQIAHAMLQRDNLSAAESRVGAILAVQPNNRDALSMREDLSARQQRRDAALDTARGCEYMGRWTCAWHNAGNALVIDSSSEEAKRIVAEAMHEAQSRSVRVAAPVTEPPHEPLPHH